MKYITIGICLLFANCSCGQFLLGLHSEFDDSYRSWGIVAEYDSTTQVEGTLEITWTLDDDFSEWHYELGEISGEIRQKYLNNPSLWELRQGSEVVIIKQKWPGDFSEWIVSSDSASFTIKTRFGNIVDEWRHVSDRYGELMIYTETPGDARDWQIEDFMEESIPFSMRMGAVFISIFTSVPKV